MDKVIIRGRSIDGTVFYMPGGGWTDSIKQAAKLSPEIAERIMNERRERNRNCDPDAMIGRLETIAAK